MKYFISTIIWLFIAFYGCNSRKTNNTQKKDSFYTDKGFDQKRIPLIKPYKLLKVNADEWRMDLFAIPPIALSIHNVKGINVSNGKILIYSEGGTEVEFKQYNRAWFIVEPSVSKEIAFSDYKIYADSLRIFNITDTTFNLPDIVYEYFYDTGKLKWNINVSN